MTRRDFLPSLAAAGVAGALVSGEASGQERTLHKGRLKQCVTTGVFRGANMNLDEMSRHAAELGCYGFDLIGPKDWPILKKYGLVPTMMPPPWGGTISDGVNEKGNHDRLEKTTHEAIDLCAAAGAPNVIVMSGNRRGMKDDVGAGNCVEFLHKVKKHAEDKGILLQMELLNSKVDHKDYMCDHATWGIEVMKRVGSPNVKLLYDIYHMQIMDGDIVRTIRENIVHFGHFHTGGNPGRHEIDDTQELNYHVVAKAIADAGFTGQVAHEYTPAAGNDVLKSLEAALKICEV